jgi:GGDEF domain-containing protein
MAQQTPNPMLNSGNTPTAAPSSDYPTRNYGPIWESIVAAQGKPQRTYDPAWIANHSPNWQQTYWNDPGRISRWQNVVKMQPPSWQAPPWLNTEAIDAMYNYMAYANGGADPALWKALADDDPAQYMFGLMPVPPESAQLPSDADALDNEAAKTPEWFDALKEAMVGQYQTPEYIAAAEAAGYSFRFDPQSALFYPTPPPEAQQPRTEELPEWQKRIGYAFSSPILSSTFQGGIAGGIMSGPAGILPGMLFGLGLGALSTKEAASVANNLLSWIPGYSEDNYRRTINNALMLMPGNLIQSGIERAIGSSIQVYGALTNPEKYGDIEELLNNIPDAWRAAGMTFETYGQQLQIGNLAPALYGERQAKAGEMLVLGEARPVKTNVQAGLAGLTEMRRMFDTGEAYTMARQALGKEDVGLDEVFMVMQSRYGFSGMVGETIGQLATALPSERLYNYASKAAMWTFAKAARDPNMLLAVQRTGGRPTDAMALYRILERQTKSVEDLAQGSFLTRWLTGVTKEGQDLIMTPSKVTLTDKLRGGLVTGVMAGLGGYILTGSPMAAIGAAAGTFPVGWRWSYIGQLTPASRASEVVNGAVLNLEGTLARAGDDPTLGNQYIHGIANTPVELAEQLSMPSIAGADGQIASVAIRASRAVDAADKVLATWKSSEWARTMVDNIARATGQDSVQVLKALVNAGQGADVLIRRFVDAATKSDAPEAKAIVDSYRSGELTPAKVADIAKLFTGDNPAPINLDLYHAQLLSAVSEKMAGWAADTFNVKPDPLWARLGQTVKAAQSLALLGLNPGYLMNNTINNFVVMASQGVFGLHTFDTIAKIWDAEGIVPPRLQAGIGPDALGLDLDYSPLREATRAKDTLQAIKDTIRSGPLQKLAVASQLSGKVEQFSSANAFTNAYLKMKGKLWKAGDGFERLPPALEQALGGINPNLPDFIYSAIRGGANQKQVEAALFDTVSRAQLDAAIPAIARNMGVSEDVITDTLQHSGVYGALKTALENAKTNEDVRRAFSNVDKGMQDWFAEHLTEMAEQQAFKIAAKVHTEGMFGVVQAYDDMRLQQADTAIKHFADLEDAFARANKAIEPGERSRIIREQLDHERQRYDALNRNMAATYKGMFEGLGLESADARASLSSFDEFVDNWQQFFTERDRQYKQFFRTNYETPELRSSAWRNLQEAMLELYQDASTKEVEIQGRMDGAFAQAMRTQYGDGVSADVQAWRGKMNTFNQERGSMMSRFRQATADMTVEERNTAWREFINKGYTGVTDEGYLPFVRRYLQEEINGAHILYNKATGKGQLTLEEAPPQVPAPSAAAEPVPLPEARPAPETPSPQLTPEARPVPTTHPYDAQAVRNRANELGIPTATEAGVPLDKVVVATVNKYLKTAYTDIRDIHPDQVAAAVAAKQLIADAQLKLDIAPAIDLAEGVTFRASDADLTQQMRDEITALRAENQRLATRFDIPRYEANQPQVDAAPIKIAVDVQGLGAMNDKFGHAAGDALLKAFGQEAKRLGMDVYHVSGDEWVIAWSGDQDGANTAAEQLRNAWADAEITVELPDGSITRYKGFGIYTGTGDTFEHAYNAVNTAKSARTYAKGEFPPAVVKVGEAGAVPTGGEQGVPVVPKVTPGGEQWRGVWVKDIISGKLDLRYLPEGAKAGLRSGLGEMLVEIFTGEPPRTFGTEAGESMGVKSQYPMWYREGENSQYLQKRGVNGIVDALRYMIDDIDNRLPTDPTSAKIRKAEYKRNKLYGILKDEAVSKGLYYEELQAAETPVIAVDEPDQLTAWGNDYEALKTKLQDPQIDKTWLAERANELRALTYRLPDQFHEMLADDIMRLRSSIERLDRIPDVLRGQDSAVARQQQIARLTMKAVVADQVMQGLLPAGGYDDMLNSLLDYVYDQGRVPGVEKPAFIEASRAIDRARAASWASRTGQPISEWYKQIAGVTMGGDVVEGLRQGVTVPRPVEFKTYGEGTVRHWEVSERDFVDHAWAREQNIAQRTLEVRRNELAQLGPKAVNKRHELERTVSYWETMVARAEPNEKQIQSFREQYIETVRKALSHGEPVPEAVIDQRPEFAKAQNARERYEKGRHTSFANRSAAINDTMQIERGFKVKRQDGKPIAEPQIEEISQGVSELERVFGSLQDLMSQTDITIAHTSGKHPFLRSSGGSYTPDEKTITMGVAGVNSLGHEMGHWLDMEAGKLIRAEARARVGDKMIRTSSIAEADGRYGPLISKASYEMNDTYTVRKITKSPDGKLTVEERNIKEHLGPYWREPREIFARLFEEYVAVKLGGEGAVSVDADYYNTPGWWSEDKFANLMPEIETEINRRLDILRGNAETIANQVHISQPLNGPHGTYYIADIGMGYNRPSVEIQTVPESEWIVQKRGGYDHDTHTWSYQELSRLATLDEAKTYATQYLQEQHHIAVEQPVTSAPKITSLTEPLSYARGALSWGEDGKAIIHAFKAADASTYPHEFGHLFRSDMVRMLDQALPEYRAEVQADIATMNEWTASEVARLNALADAGELSTVQRRNFFVDEAGKPVERIVAGSDEAWSVAREEIFARGLERYLADGTAPTSALRTVFENFKKWLLRIYTSLKGTEIDLQISEEMRQVFDRMLTEASIEAPPAFTRTGQATMFGAGEDLPLFSGTAPRAQADMFAPQEQGRTELMPGFEELYKPQMKGAVEGGEVLVDLFNQKPFGDMTFAEFTRAVTVTKIKGKFVVTHEPEYGGVKFTWNSDQSSAAAALRQAHRRIIEQDMQHGIIGKGITEYPDLEAKASSIKPNTLLQQFVPLLSDPQFIDYLGAVKRYVASKDIPLLERVDFSRQTIADETEYPRRVKLWQTIAAAAPDVTRMLDVNTVASRSDWYSTPNGSERILYQADNGTVTQQGDGSTAVTPPDGEPVRGAGDVPPGTTDSLQTQPPIWDMQMDGYDRHIKPMMNGLQDYMLNPRNKRASLRGANMDAQTAGQLQDYLQKVWGQMAETKLTSVKYAERQRDMALLNYNKRYGADNLLEMVIPYQFWFTRSALNWALRAIDRPSFLIAFNALKQLQDKVSGAEIPGIPTRLRGKMKINIPFLPDWMGGALYIDPFRQLFPFAQLMQPLEQMRKDKNTVERRAESIIQSQVGDGDVTEDEATQAISTRKGAIWENAFTQATMDTENDRPDPFEYAALLTGFSLPVQWAYMAATGQKEKIGSLPITRTIKAATTALGMNQGRGINIEDPIRRAVGLPLQMDRWEQYRTERELANMAGDGTITADDALRAMMDRQGQYYVMAQARVSQEQSWRTLFSWLSADVFPEGEAEQRALRDKYIAALEAGQAGDKQAITRFFDESPEYRARLAMGQEPEERLRRYLISQVWDGYMALPDLHKKQVREQMGALFDDAFLNKETRSYDAITTPTLTQWAQAIGAQTPKAAGEVPAKELDFASPELAQMYQQFKDEEDNQFPNLNAIYEQINALPANDPRVDELFSLPEMQEYEAWKNEWLANYPQLIPYVIGKDNKLAGVDPEIQGLVYQFGALKQRQFPQLDSIMDAYYAIPAEDANGRAAWRAQNAQAYAQIKGYYDFRDAYMKQFPQSIPYLMSVEGLANAVLGNNYGSSSSGSSSSGGGYTKRSYSSGGSSSSGGGSTAPSEAKYLNTYQIAQFSNPLVRQLYGYYYGVNGLESGAMRELGRLWKDFGKPGKDMQDWIDRIVKPSFIT